ncbi:MAG: glycosyltransferase family 2 protein [Coprococcus sp.]
MTALTEKSQKDEVQVSVIIPVHNGAAYILKALESVLLQNVPLEIIIVDDGSTDDLMSVLAPFLIKPEIHLIRNMRNIGVAESRNKGVRAARGTYVAFLDCDDWWEPQKLIKQLDLMKKTGSVLCATGRRLITPSGEPTDKIIGVKEKLTYRDLLFQNPINCSSVVIKRDVAVSFPMSHDECHEDYIMWFQILKQYKRACAINEPLLNYRLSNTGKSGNKFKSARMTFRVYRHMGFGILKSLVCFAGYAINGVRKYYLHS